MWNSGVSGGSFSEVVGYTTDYTLLSKTISPVFAGTVYQFKYAAKNDIGWGEFSEVVSIKAASKPD